MPTPREDWEFIKKEFGVLKKFLKKYFKERSEDSDFDRTVALLDYGPFNWAKLAIAVIATLICLFSFHLYQSWSAVWVIILIFAIFYDFLLVEEGKQVLTPFIKELFGFFMQIPRLLFDILVSIVMYFKEAIMGMFKSKEE